MIISHNHAHVTIPLTLTNIRQKLNAAHDFSKMLLKLTKKGRFSDGSDGDLILKALSSATDSRFEIINNLYESAIYYGTENKMSDTELTFIDLKTRNRKSLETFLPTNKVRSRNFPSHSNNALNTIMNLNQRRSYDGAQATRSRTRQGPATPAPTPAPTRQSPATPAPTPAPPPRRAPPKPQEEGDSDPDPEPEGQGDDGAEAEAEAEAEGNSGAEPGEGSNETQANNESQDVTTKSTTTTSTTTTQPPGHLDLQGLYGQPDPNAGQENPGDGQVDPNAGTEDNDTVKAIEEEQFQRDPENFPNRFQTAIQDLPNARDKRSVSKRSANSIDKVKDFGVSILHRTRRQLAIIGGAVLSLLSSIGVSTAFGAYDANQIGKIKGTVNDMNRRQELMIHQLEVDSDAIMLNRHKLQSLESLTIKLGEFATTTHFQIHGMTVFMLANAEFDRIEDELSRFLLAIEAAQGRRLHSGVLSQRGGIETFERVKSMAQARDLIPVISNPQQLSQLETNFYYVDGGVHLVIEVPLCSNSDTFYLFQFLPLPVQLSTEAYVRIAPEKQILAVGEMNIRGRAPYIEMSLLDLAQCRKLGRVYICSEQRVVHKPSGQTCLYALYVADRPSAIKACRVLIESQGLDQVVPVGHDTFRYYSAHAGTYRYRCQNSSMIVGSQLQDITEIQVPVNCRAETSAFILHRQNDLFMEVRPQEFSYNLPVLDFLAKNTKIKDVITAVQVMKETPGAPEIDQETIQRIKEMQKPEYLNPIPMTSILVSAVSLILAIILICICCYAKRKEANEVRQRTDYNVRFKNLIRGEGVLDALEHLLTNRRPE